MTNGTTGVDQELEFRGLRPEQNIEIDAIGTFDGIEHNALIGWAHWNGAPVRIIASIDGIELEVANSDRMRPDLAEAGIGACAFFIPIPDHFLDGTAHLIEFHNADTGSAILGEGSLQTFPYVRIDAPALQALAPTVGQPADDREISETSPTFEALMSSLFDPKFYLKRYPDVAQADVDPFHHFIGMGIKENRTPNIWFDSDWYSHENGIEANAFLHFIEHGIAFGSVPLPELGDTFGRTEANIFTLESYIALTDATIKLGGLFELELPVLRFLCQTFDPLYYNFLIDNKDEPSVCELIHHYLSYGIHHGLPFSRAFNADYYIERGNLEYASEPAVRTNHAISHWLDIGSTSHMVGSPAFDSNQYLAFNQDVADANVDPYVHYLKFGVFEGRRITKAPPIPVAIKGGPNWGFGTLPLNLQHLEGFSSNLPTFLSSLSTAVSSAEFEEVSRKARDLEPEIPHLEEYEAFLVAPYHSMHSHALASICNRLDKRQYDFIICLPWMRMGGADLIGALLRENLGKLHPDASILVIQTDSPVSDWKSWFPPNIDILDISDITNSNMDRRGVEYLFFVLLRALNPTHIFNLNSRLCFDVFERFGKRLSEVSKTFSYFFCWDQTEKGRRVGYPSMYFPSIIAETTGVITDSSFLRNELIKIYRLPKELQDKVHVVHTPLHGEWNRESKTRERMEQTVRRRPLFLWAGRIDRQKRFDLVCQIAERMPDIDFWCWGAPILDAGAALPDMPSNLLLRKPYSSYSELPMKIATGWLYTSGWDGMPTLIIEIASRGIPMVASDVGGIHELIDESTGWPIDNEADVASYVKAIREVVANPDLAQTKAKKLQRRATQKYSVEQYQKKILSILAS